MDKILIKNIHRRNPFKIKSLPFLAHLYLYCIKKSSTKLMSLFLGLPSLLLFFLFQRLSPFKHRGRFILNLNHKNKIITFDARNTQFQALYRKDFLNGYEPELTALLDIVMPLSGVFYDIGSNWGLFSLFVASKPGFRGKIFAFEPFPSSYKDLKDVVMQSGLTNIKCYPYALSDKNGTTSMLLPDFIHSGFAVTTNNTIGKIRMFKLDSLNIDPPSVIKIDAEGAENTIMTGGRNIISKYKPMIIFENVKNFKNVTQTINPLVFLRDLGYLFFHPCWLKQNNSLSFFMSSEIQTDLRPSERLSLVPFTFENRFLHYDQINFFACHKNNLNIIGKSFAIYKKHE